MAGTQFQHKRHHMVPCSFPSSANLVLQSPLIPPRISPWLCLLEHYPLAFFSPCPFPLNSLQFLPVTWDFARCCCLGFHSLCSLIPWMISPAPWLLQPVVSWWCSTSLSCVSSAPVPSTRLSRQVQNWAHPACLPLGIFYFGKWYMMLSNCGAREDAWESLGQQGDQPSRISSNEMDETGAHYTEWSKPER